MEQITPNGSSKMEGMEVKNVYYLIWSDSILSFKKHHPQRTDWKTAIFLLNTWINALNWWIIFIWLKFFNIFSIPLIKINLFPGTMLNDFIAFTIVFALPFGFLNYFFIFHNDRYKRIVERYPSPPKKIAFIYSSVVALAAFVTAILYGVLK